MKIYPYHFIFTDMKREREASPPSGSAEELEMAALLFNHNLGSGLHNLTHNFTRLHPLHWSGDLTSSLSFHNDIQTSFHKTYIRQLEVKRCSKRLWILTRSSGDDSSSTFREGTDEHISAATLIWRAVKLPIYSVAVVPLTVGSAAAYLHTGHFSTKQYLILLASSVFVITWLNLSNDVYDFDTGADKDKKESVVNLIGSRTGTLVTACILLALGFIGLTWASMEAGNLRSMLLLASAIVCGYTYQCPPFRLSYKGLGEPLCFAAFGPFATTAFYLLQSNSRALPITGTILSASLLVGFTTSLILFCSHFHQIEGDRAVGKMSPLVRLGTETGSNVVKVTVISLYSLLFILGLCKALPFTSIVLCAFTMPIGKLVVDFVNDNHEDKTNIFMAKYYCVRLHALFGTALAAGLVAARTIPRNLIPISIFT